LTSEGVGSLLCVTSCVLDKFLMVAFTDTSKEINGTAKQNHVINKFGKGVHFWKLPSLSYSDPSLSVLGSIFGLVSPFVR